MLHKAMGWFLQEQIRDRMREIFCKNPPSRLSSGKGNTEMTRVVSALELSVTHAAVAWLLTEGVLLQPCPGVSPEREDRRSWVCSSVVGEVHLLWSLPYTFLEKKNWLSLHGRLHQARELEPRCAKTSGHLSQLSPCVDAAAHPGCAARM